jgi:hypothetical protein
MRTATILAAAAAVAATAALAEPVADGGKKLTTALSGANEVPPNSEAGTGSATIVVNPGQSRVCWEITTSGFDPTNSITGAHIHSAPAGVNGPVVVPLTATLNGTSAGCADVTRSLADGIRKAPQGYYVNVHTNVFPGGAIRGQLG